MSQQAAEAVRVGEQGEQQTGKLFQQMTETKPPEESGSALNHYSS